VGLPQASVSSAALVTGASSGIGAAVATELASRGYPLILVARREERLRTLATELSSEHGTDAEVITADLGEESERARLEDEVRDRGRSVEVLVNNAGFGHQADFARSPSERMVEMVRVNVEAVVDLTSRFLASMVERGRGSVINVASTAAFQPMPGSAVYAASKSFVLSFSEAIRTELRGTGVTVTAVCPGPVRTEFGEQGGFGGADERIPAALWLSAEKVARDALAAVERGDRVSVPGPHNRIAALWGQHLPRSILLPLVKSVWPVS
jgi:uncharacterized protein